MTSECYMGIFLSVMFLVKFWFSLGNYLVKVKETLQVAMVIGPGYKLKSQKVRQFEHSTNDPPDLLYEGFCV